MVTQQLKYLEVRDRIVAMIRDGSHAAGDRLPPERQLAKDLACSFTTLRQALSLLVDDGLLVRRIGSGTFITEQALDGSRGVQQHTRNKVKKNTYGVLLVEEFQPYAFKILRALREVAQGAEKELFTRSVASSLVDGAQEAIDDLAAQGCGSVIIPWFNHKSVEISRLVHLHTHAALPLVITDLIPGLEQACCTARRVFGLGDAEAVTKACQYFTACGYRHIGFLGPNDYRENAMQRRLMAYTGFICSTKDNVNLAGVVGPQAKDIDAVVERWLPYKGELAVVCYDDTYALRLLTAAHKFGLHVPRDIAVLGCNDIEQAVHADPPLSTLFHDYQFIGEALLRHADARSNGGMYQVEQETPLGIVVRESCGGKMLPEKKLQKILRSLAMSGSYQVI